MLVNNLKQVKARLTEALLAVKRAVTIMSDGPLIYRCTHRGVNIVTFRNDTIGADILLRTKVQGTDIIVTALRRSTLGLTLMALYGRCNMPRAVIHVDSHSFTRPCHLTKTARVVDAMSLTVGHVIGTVRCPRISTVVRFRRKRVRILGLSVPGGYAVIKHDITRVTRSDQFPINALVVNCRTRPRRSLDVPGNDSVVRNNSAVLTIAGPRLIQRLVSFVKLYSPPTSLTVLT